MAVIKLLKVGTNLYAASIKELAVPAFKNPNTYKYSTQTSTSDLSGTMMPVEPAVQVFKPKHTNCLWDSRYKPSCKYQNGIYMESYLQT